MDGMDTYSAIASVIDHIVAHRLERESLETVAASMGMTPDRLRKHFAAWTGITPTQFGRYLSLAYAKELLAEDATSLAAAHRAGLSGGGRLHDLFVDIEAMTPGEFKRGGAGLTLSYHTFPTRFGLCLVAASGRGITNILFAESHKEAHAELRARWPHASIMHKRVSAHDAIEHYFSGITPDSRIKLHLRGTNFQIKVWEALLSIPEGGVTTYQDIAERAGIANAQRATGTAIGANPVAHIIPCHRVLRASGHIGGYRWGATRKRAMLADEALRRAD